MSYGPHHPKHTSVSQPNKFTKPVSHAAPEPKKLWATQVMQGAH